LNNWLSRIDIQKAEPESESSIGQFGHSEQSHPRYHRFRHSRFRHDPRRILRICDRKRDLARNEPPSHEAFSHGNRVSGERRQLNQQASSKLPKRRSSPEELFLFVFIFCPCELRSPRLSCRLVSAKLTRTVWLLLLLLLLLPQTLQLFEQLLRSLYLLLTRRSMHWGLLLRLWWLRLRNLCDSIIVLVNFLIRRRVVLPRGSLICRTVSGRICARTQHDPIHATGIVDRAHQDEVVMRSVQK
jgi:hypothetical protein